MENRSTIIQDDKASNNVGELAAGILLHRGEYQIIKTLGRGGFGITYLAEHLTTHRVVCIKEFFPSTFYRRSGVSSSLEIKDADNAEIMNRFRLKFLKEASTISSMHHPNIVKVLASFEENETAYYVMEYIDGESLHTKMSRGALEVHKACSYIMQVADALEYIHSKNTLHLDIKPHNIMVRSDDSVVVIDFGLAKHYDEESGSATTTTLGAHSDGYAPIEQYGGGSLSTFSPETDIYSLGATLYALVMGVRPPRANELVRKGTLVVGQHIPYGVSNTIECCMRYDATQRPHSIKEFRSLMLQSKRPKSSKWWLWLLLVLLAVVGVGVVFFINYNDDSSAIQEVTTESPALPEVVSDEHIDEEELVDEDENKFAYKTYSYVVTTACDMESSLTVDFPISGDPNLVRNIQEWIVSEIAYGYSGNIADAESIMAYCKNNDMNDDAGYGDTEIKVIYETDKIVTFSNQGVYAGYGAASGGWNISGTTFRKIDGKRFLNNLINIPTYELQSSIKRQLKQYFGVTTDEELSSWLFLEAPYGIDNIPLPEYNEPWITSEGLVYYYSKYEICGGADSPYLIFPFDEIKEYLSPMVIDSFF